MTKQMIRAIRDVYCDERECGHTICDFDDREHDLREIAEVVGVEMVYDEDEEEWIFNDADDYNLVSEALDYYYDLHGC